jgi:hypothetical protein
LILITHAFVMVYDKKLVVMRVLKGINHSFLELYQLILSSNCR